MPSAFPVSSYRQEIYPGSSGNNAYSMFVTPSSSVPDATNLWLHEQHPASMSVAPADANPRVWTDHGKSKPEHRRAHTGYFPDFLWTASPVLCGLPDNQTRFLPVSENTQVQRHHAVATDRQARGNSPQRPPHHLASPVCVRLPADFSFRWHRGVSPLQAGAPVLLTPLHPAAAQDRFSPAQRYQGVPHVHRAQPWHPHSQDQFSVIFAMRLLHCHHVRAAPRNGPDPAISVAMLNHSRQKPVLCITIKVRATKICGADS